MLSDNLANYFKQRPDPVEKRPIDRLMDKLNKMQNEEQPSRLRYMPPDPTATRHPDGDTEPPTPRPKRKRYLSPSM